MFQLKTSVCVSVPGVHCPGEEAMSCVQVEWRTDARYETMADAGASLFSVKYMKSDSVILRMF